MSKYLLILLGGGLGAVARFVITTLISRVSSMIFPLGTFLINVSGSFCIGLLMTFFLNRPHIHTNWRLFLVTGILGGFTTFSSFEWEAMVALRSNAVSIGLLYVGLSVVLGLAAAWVASALATWLWPH